MFDMSKCKPGDRLLTRDGSEVIFVRKSLHEIYPYIFSLKLSLVSEEFNVTKNGMIYNDGRISSLDIMARIIHEEMKTEKLYKIGDHVTFTDENGISFNGVIGVMPNEKIPDEINNEVELKRKIRTLKIYLKSGNIFYGKYDENEYDDVYDAWFNKSGMITFNNGEVITGDIEAIEWEV